MNEEKITVLAKKLTENIKNGTIYRKTYSTSIGKYNDSVEELCLFRYKRYLGSLRCMLDTANMRKAYMNEKEITSVKKLVRKKDK